MTIQQNLFLAILAMDSYNRGYNAGVDDGQNIVNGIDEDGLGGEGSQIGNALVSQQDISEAAKAAGFYAIAYEIKDDSIEGLANGQKVISYRGSDNPGSWTNLDPWSTTPGGDAWNGWSVGAGSSTSEQGRMAHYCPVIERARQSYLHVAGLSLTNARLL